MHLAIVGAGALGRIYGVRLAEDGADVSFVVRPSRLGERAPFVLERVGGLRGPETLEHPRRVASIPPSATVVLVTVRFDQLEADGTLADLLRRAPPSPVVVLTPLLPGQRGALEAAVSRRITPAMPGAVGYLDARGIVRYWLPALAPTLFEVPDPHRDDSAFVRGALEALAHRLTRSGIPSHLEADVAAINSATTASFFPLIVAIDLGGGVEGILRDRPLLATVRGALDECALLARAVGKPALWAPLLGRLTSPLLLGPGVALARSLAPETLHFVEEHFGAKLHEQHRAMADSLLALGEGHGIAMPALAELRERLA